MKISIMARLAILLLIASTLSACLWVVDEGGPRRGGGGGDRGMHNGERHGDRH